MPKQDKYQGYENPEAFRADIERRRSSAGMPHADKRTKRARTRGASERREVDKSSREE